MNMSSFFILLLILAIWLSVLTYLLVRIYKLFSSLQNGIEADFEKKGFSEVKKRLSIIEQESKGHTQKVSLIRFNPFKELGGDHSFCLAILDANNTGVIITSLHTRDRTRVYMKKVIAGKSDIELSQEELKALKEAIK